MPTMMLWSAGGIDALERPKERGEIERRLNGIVESVEGGELAGQPLHDAPRMGKCRFRLAGRDR
jgi:hypothetical protein